MSYQEAAAKLHRRNRIAAIIADTYLGKLDELAAVAHDAAVQAGESPEKAEQEAREVRVGLPVARQMIESLLLAINGPMSPAVQDLVTRDPYMALRLKVVIESTGIPE